MTAGHDTTIDTIYAAIGDEEAYDSAIRAISESLGASSGWFMVEGDGSVGIDRAHNFDLSFIPQYEAYYHAHDLWWNARPRMMLDTAISFERFVPESAFERSELYNDILRDNGGQYHGIGLLMQAEDTVFIVALQRTSKGEAFDRRSETALQSLAPHIGRMALTRRRIAPARQRAQLSDAGFQQLKDAVYLCDPRGIVVHRNTRARDLAPGGPALAADGRLRLGDPIDARHFARAMRDAVALGASTVLLIDRPGKLPLRITIDPVRLGKVAVTVTVQDHERQLHQQLDHAQAIYALTPSERALSESLARGRTIEQHASLRDVSVATVRTQLRSVFAKSRTSRQAELVAAILRC